MSLATLFSDLPPKTTKTFTKPTPTQETASHEGPKDTVTLRRTGFASPTITGRGASLMAANPDLTPAQVKSLLTQG